MSGIGTKPTLVPSASVVRVLCMKWSASGELETSNGKAEGLLSSQANFNDSVTLRIERELNLALHAKSPYICSNMGSCFG